MAKPFLKWAGNKARIAPRLRQVLPSDRRLIEPFLGSGAVFVGNHDKYEAFVLSDVNEDLIALYRHLRDHPDEFVSDARTWFNGEENARDAYYRNRARFNELAVGDWERALLFVYLNRHGFNGLCRYNQKGEFNVPFGRFKAPYFPEAEMRTFASVASKAEFECADFRTIMAMAGPGDVVYCDPPYVPLSLTANFTSYATEGFGPEEQRALATAAEEAAGRGAFVAVSNHANEFTRTIYRGARRIDEFEVPRFISAQGKRERALELLAVFAPEHAIVPTFDAPGQQPSLFAETP